MYTSRQGIYTISGDMCYENKIMSNAALPTRCVGETVCLNVAEHDRIAGVGGGKEKRSKPKFRAAHVVNAAIFIGAGALIILTELGYLPQTKRGFYCNDPLISHNYYGDTVTNTMLLTISFLGPLLFFLLVEFLRVGRNSKLIGRLMWKWYRELLIGLTVTLVITEVCKVVGGELRPHFLHTCSPDAAETCETGAFVVEYQCTNTVFKPSLIVDSARSFPSGHTAIGMFVSIFLAAYLQVRLTTRSIGMLVKPFLIAVVMLWGPTCGLTRITDHRHHWWDVLAGGVLGVSGALYAIFVLCSSFQSITNDSSTRHEAKHSSSTTTLLDIKNKDATSVII